jgi:RNA 2',3'-cyclic 3'-phosphodiesterase
MGMIRAFIALDLAAESLQRLEEVNRQLKQRLPGAAVRWVAVKNIHLTLKFLGDVSEANLPVVYEIIRKEAEKQASFEIHIGGLGVFPSVSRPRVIWVGVQAPPELAAVQHIVDVETARIGYASEERAFSPHLTLGRVTRNALSEEIRQIANGISLLNIGDLGASRIQAVHFYRSDLTPQGSIYTRLYSAPFKP